MNKLTRTNALALGALALLISAMGPWVTVFGGLFSAGPTNSTEPALIVFGGLGLVILSAITGKYMRPVSIVVGVLVLAEAANVFVRMSTDTDSELVSPGWGLYLTVLSSLFLIVSTFITKDKPSTTTNTDQPTRHRVGV